MIDACICTIGDEILIGQIIDTNSAYISKVLNSLGVKVVRKISISDNLHDIKSSLSEVAEKYDIIIITGGLGPTKDDITKKALCDLFNSESFHYDKKQLEYIKNISRLRGVKVSGLNRKQALVPDNCTVINNYKGTAPGMLFRRINYKKYDSLIFALPGVPYEMEALMPEVCNIITNEFVLEDIVHKNLITYGIAESALAIKLDHWERALPQEIKLAYLPNPSVGIKLRLSKYGGNKESSETIISKYANELYTLLGDLIYGEDNDTLEKVVSEMLRKNHKTLSIAESCTGGRVSALLTSLSGASEIFMGSAVVYSNESKTDLINVDPEIFIKYGAVSKECAEQMAVGIRRRVGTDYGISITGIAGPGGGSTDKPVGTVWIAISGEGFTLSRRSVFTGDRERNIIRFASEALNFLRLTLNKENQVIKQ